MIDWINKHLTHPRDRDGDYGIRVLMHIPIGIIIGILLVLYPYAGMGLTLIFLVYEWTEDWRTFDHAWKDLAGAIAGCVLGIGIGIII